MCEMTERWQVVPLYPPLAWLREAGKPVWPRDIELAEKAVAENKRAVLLGEGSVLYVSGPPQAERQ